MTSQHQSVSLFEKVFLSKLIKVHTWEILKYRGRCGKNTDIFAPQILSPVHSQPDAPMMKIVFSLYVQISFIYSLHSTLGLLRGPSRSSGLTGTKQRKGRFCSYMLPRLDCWQCLYLSIWFDTNTLTEHLKCFILFKAASSPWANGEAEERKTG